MVDALVSGASVERRAGSSPVLGTVKSRNSLKIKSCGISLLIFVPRLSPKSFLSKKNGPNCKKVGWNLCKSVKLR